MSVMCGLTCELGARPHHRRSDVQRLSPSNTLRIYYNRYEANPLQMGGEASG